MSFSRSRRLACSAPLAASLALFGWGAPIARAAAAPPDPQKNAPPGLPGVLKFAIRMPREVTAKPPVLFLMHGFGSDEQDLLPLADALPPTLLVISLRAPNVNDGNNGTGGQGYRWFKNIHQDGGLDGNGADIAASRIAIEKSVDALIKHFGADPQRVFLGGFSQGAIMTYVVTLSRPDRYRGAIVLSGALLPAVMQQLDAPANQASASQRAHLPVFVGHGNRDRTIPFAYADRAAMTLNAWHVPLSFHAYADMGHEVKPAETADLAAWMQPLINPSANADTTHRSAA